MIVDDKNGRLVTTRDYYSINSGSIVGDIIYPHGLVVVTNEELANMLEVSKSLDITWNSSLPIFTTHILCKVKDYEFNYSLNPSCIDNVGNLKSNLTGSQFTPYITSIGLYNDVNELIAVAKTSRPIPKSQDIDMTFIIKLDT